MDLAPRQNGSLGHCPAKSRAREGGPDRNHLHGLRVVPQCTMISTLPRGKSFNVTHSSSKSSNDYQVVVVGFGPSGAVATSLLGSHGIRTLTIDRLRTVYDKPRAIAIDHEILRLFDNLGVADRVLPYVAPFPASQHFGAEGQLIRRIDMVPDPIRLATRPVWCSHSHRSKRPCVTMRSLMDVLRSSWNGTTGPRTIRGGRYAQPAQR